MGLFDRITSLFGSDTTDTGRGENHGTGGPPVGGGGQQLDAGQPGPSMQSHGSHWDTLVPDDGREATIKDQVMEAVSTGEPIEGVDLDGTPVTGHRVQDGPLGTVAVSVGQQIATAYPVAEGVTHTVDMTELNEWEAGIEAWLSGTLADARITTFASNYFQYPAERFGGECDVSLAILMYTVGQADNEVVVDEQGNEQEVSSDFAGFRPWERGAPDDYVLRTTIDTVEPISYGKFDAYRIEAPLFRTPDEQEFDVALYVGTHLIDDEPHPGDQIEGAGWMQAWFK